MQELAFPLLVGLIILALAFDFLNGLHDAANSIATVVSTRLMSPVMAVLFAAGGNFAAYWLVGHGVAKTIAKGIIDPNDATPAVIFGALMGAIFWNIATWLRGIPSSSSHALIGGLLGAAVAHSGFGTVQSAGTLKTILAIFLSPVIGFAFAMLMVLITSWLFKGYQPRRAEGIFKTLHLFSSAAYSISHGGNDAQKTMGIITLLLYTTGQFGNVSVDEMQVPDWVAVACYLAISLGTISGGWKIIKTMGTKLTKLNHHTGFSASTAGSIVVFGASAMGIPISTTHAITGAVIGTGAARKASAVRWGIATRVVMAWFITIPASAAVGALFYTLTRMF
jgi:PiT family inorganic phosphate transporter